MARSNGRKLRLKLAVAGVLAGMRVAVADPGEYTIQQIGIPIGNNGVGPNFIDAAGEVAGLTASVNFNNGSPRFLYTSWYYSPTAGTTTLIGLTDALHTAPGGVPANVDVCMNRSGVVAGEAESFGTKGGGQDAWVYSPSSNTTQMIGLLDADHVSDGLRTEWVQGINSSGEVLGRATSYDGANGSTGTDVWIYSPSTNTAQIIGLTDALHTDSSDFNSRLDFPGAINDAGSAIGSAQSYLPDGGQGLDAWYYSPSTNTSQVIGLTDPVHTDSNGTSYNWALLLSENGSAAGTAQRYSGSTNEGQDAWV